MKVLVTGGAGYIGSVTTAALLDAGHAVTVFDNLATGHRAAIPRAAAFCQGDIRSKEDVASCMAEGFDAIVHFAAYIEAGESMVDPGKFFENNTCGALNLIESAVRHGVGRFVFSSTAAVYAGQDEPIEETDPIAPVNAYGATKLMVEQMLAWYRQIHGLRYGVLRYFNACGATGELGEDHQPESHLIPLVLQVALGKREKVKIYGTDYPTRDGTCIRDYIHVADLASAHLLALDALAARETLTCNLGNGAGYSVREVVDAAREVTGRPIPAEETPRRPGDAAILVADATRARELLGWQPQIPDLRDIMKSAWDWRSKHPEGYDR
ncbi:MAG: UDP-glucose 4-epimerase GalE [Anaerolineae bacterium]|jgi:UDP-glucose 4-epimerase|nr:UDP-glucose 4-epimerase GalE [Anaerolineae bacterium]